MAAAGASPASALQARLLQAEQTLLRDMYRWIPVSEYNFVDSTGLVYLPVGQTINLRLVHSDGKAALLHTCLVASAAEVDFVLRAVHLFRANGSAMLEITPLIVTLYIDPATKKAAEENGVLVSVNGVQPALEPGKAARTASSAPAVERVASTSRPAAPETTKSSGSLVSGRPRANSDEKGSSVLRHSTLLSPSAPALTGSQLGLSASASRVPPSGSDTSLAAASSAQAAPTPSTDVAGAWRTLLLAAGIDAAIVPQLADVLTGGGLVVPADLNTLPWEKMKDLGIKMGQLTRLQKHVAGRTSGTKPVA